MVYKGKTNIMIKHIYKLFIFIFLLFISNYSFSETYMDQWEDSDKSYLDLIEQGYQVIAYDMSNFKDKMGNMYMFFVTVLQKNKTVFECQEYQIFDEYMNTIDLTVVCRKLVQPFKKGGLCI